MMPETLVNQFRVTRHYFRKTCECLDEADSAFAPAEGMFTVAQQVAHTAQTVDWFREGAFGSGFDMDFEAHESEVRKVTSLAAALEWLDRAHRELAERIGSKTMEELTVPISEGPIMAGLPRMTIVSGLADHTAHHRGALSVYARLCGKTPAMPYG